MSTMSTGAGTPAWLATQNDRTAFRLLLEHGPLSRSQLGELSGASRPTAGQMIAREPRAELLTMAEAVHSPWLRSRDQSEPVVDWLRRH